VPFAAVSLLVHLEVIAFRADLYFRADVFYLFILTRDPGDALADRCEVLHGDQ